MKRIIFVFAAALLLSACGKAKEPKFAPGSMVRAVLGHHIGQITYKECSSNRCQYNVRFDVDSESGDTVLVQRRMQEFELTPVNIGEKQ